MAKYTNLKHPEKYRQEIECFALFANETLPKPAVGKYVIMGGEDEDTPDPASIPMPFNKELVHKLGVWLLRRDNKYKKGNLANTRSAVNYYYNKCNLGTPWQGSIYWRTMNGYKAARLDQAIENGEDGAAGLRAAVPEDTLIWLMDMAEKYENGHELKSMFTLMVLGWVCALRSSSMSFEIGDIKFVKDALGVATVMIVESTCLKMEDDNPSEYKQLRLPFAGFAAKDDHPRKRLFELVRLMIEFGNPCLAGQPSDANGIISGWMKDFIPDDKTNLPKGFKITSHSLRKSLASALNALGCPIHTTIMPWGRWKNQRACERYIAENFTITKFSAGMFDWMLPHGAFLKWTSDL